MKKKGFTLIELLAVIVILAIILVIAVPRILDVIEKTEMQAYKESVELMAHTATMQYETAEVTNQAPAIPNIGIVYTYGWDDTKKEGIQTNIDTVGLLNFKGDKPRDGAITLRNDKKVQLVDLVSKNNKWCAKKSYDEKSATVGRNTGNGCDYTNSVGGDDNQNQPGGSGGQEQGGEQPGGSEQQGGQESSEGNILEPQTCNMYYSSTSQSGTTTFDNTWLTWICEDTTNNTKKLCGKFPTGTVCFVSDDYSSNFGTKDANNQFVVTGYPLEKKTEITGYGGSCSVGRRYIDCNNNSANMYCSIESGGSIYCTYDNSKGCRIEPSSFTCY